MRTAPTNWTPDETRAGHHHSCRPGHDGRHLGRLGSGLVHRRSTDVAADDYIVAIDGAATVTSNSSAFGVVTATIAPVTPLNESGPRLRLQGLAGVYSYPGSTSGRTVRGEQEEGTAMFGLRVDLETGRSRRLRGLQRPQQPLSVLDPNNPVVGTGVGAKFAADLYLNPTTETLFAANASYSTLFRAYYVRVKAGFAVADGVFIGPEATLLGRRLSSISGVSAPISPASPSAR